MADTKSDQKGSHVGGHQAGRDINNYNFAPSRLAILLKKLQDESKDDQTLQEFIKDLAIFTQEVESEDVVGLEDKLTTADRKDEIDIAVRLKESIFARLQKGKFSPTFQEIYGILMAKIWSQFDYMVKPQINNGASNEDVDTLVHLHIIEPIMNEIENCGEESDITHATIRGMIYFLTGNCHIRWH